MGLGFMKRPPLAAAVMTVFAVSVLCFLGNWQIQRLHWKEGLIAQMAQARSIGPRAFSHAEIVGEGPFYARLQGRYEDVMFLVGPRTYQGRSGYHLLTPFALHGGGHVMVNRGWIPAGEEMQAGSPRGEATVTGLLRRPERPNVFVPANDPDRNVWFAVDLRRMAAAGGTDLAPLVLYAESESPESASLQPVRAALRWSPRNDHFQYALFWFGMATVLIIIFYLRFLRK